MALPERDIPGSDIELFRTRARVGIGAANLATIESLAWSDAENHPILIKTDLPLPINSVQMTVSGSPRPTGDFKLTAAVMVCEEGSDCALDYVQDFAEEHNGRGMEGQDDQVIVNDEADKTYLLGVDTENLMLGLQTCSTESFDGDTTTLGALKHGQDSFAESFEAFGKMTGKFLTGLYNAYGEDANLELVAQVDFLPAPRVETGSEARKLGMVDIGGLESQKQQIRQMLFGLTSSEVFAKWGAERQQGLLLYGPPGTGKTTLVEAVANDIGADFVVVKSTDIYDMWLGNSEKNMQKIIDKALAVTRPTVFLFDEIDGIISSDNHSSHQRVTALFKQGMTKIAQQSPQVLVAATTNHTDRMEDAVLRAGRFDVKLYIPPPDEAGRKAIFGLMVEKYVFNEGVTRDVFDLENIDYRALARATDDMTGADITTIIKGLVTFKAFEEARTKKVPAPINQAALLRAIRDYRQAASPK